ncbi:phosphonate ABC transporter, permease protein PhnE [Crocosphaera sp. Alani8]|uniref:phosphonate ABC transporter, permease protein PhnE n=1 Tax=Crocosphaera sp. Alani8 TaxID=3038952 RepID=UPI00313D5950
MTTSRKEYDGVLRRQQRIWLELLVKISLVGAIVALSFVLVGLLDLERISQGIPDFFGMLAEMLPPDFTRAKDWIEPLIDTIAMSIAGTALAIALSLHIAFLAAKNTTPHPVGFWIARMILNITRAVPELILGIILVAAVGFGTLPGVLALGLHSVGMVGKFFAEAIEHTDEAPVEAARAVGANELQIIWHSILPQVFPQMADVAFYRWEYNFRASMVLGAVGAGGIGFEIIGALRLLKYEEVSALLIVVLLMVTLVDTLSNFLREKFIEI